MLHRYGDRAPRSIAARIFGLAWMLLGIILMSIFTATLVSAIQAEDKVGSDIKGTRVGIHVSIFVDMKEIRKL